MNDILKQARKRLAEIEPTVDEGIELRAMIRAAEESHPLTDIFVFSLPKVPAGEKAELPITFPVHVAFDSFIVDSEIAESFEIVSWRIGLCDAIRNEPVPAREYVEGKAKPHSLQGMSWNAGTPTTMIVRNTSRSPSPFKVSVLGTFTYRA